MQSLYTPRSTPSCISIKEPSVQLEVQQDTTTQSTLLNGKKDVSVCFDSSSLGWVGFTRSLAGTTL